MADMFTTAPAGTPVEPNNGVRYHYRRQIHPSTTADKENFSANREVAWRFSASGQHAFVPQESNLVLKVKVQKSNDNFTNNFQEVEQSIRYVLFALFAFFRAVFVVVWSRGLANDSSEGGLLRSRVAALVPPPVSPSGLLGGVITGGEARRMAISLLRAGGRARGGVPGLLGLVSTAGTARSPSMASSTQKIPQSIGNASSQ